jgi:putative intracellular protease/amidase
MSTQASSSASRTIRPTRTRRLATGVALLLCACSQALAAATPTVLVFVAQEAVYYSEYIVLRRSLEAAGFAVEVRSSAAAPASTYLVPADSTLVAQADSLPGSSYAAFTAQFEALFDSPWNALDDALPAQAIAVSGATQDVPDMQDHVALVVVGGTGALAYRVDGDYAALGASSAVDVEDAAGALNRLALDALARGKPVMAQCHGASLAAFFRIPGTSGPGAEALGFSLLKDSPSTGFPEPATGTAYAALDVTYRPDDTLTIATPHPSLYATGIAAGRADARVVTTRDWYPQHVAHAARALINLMRTYPAPGLPPTPVRTVLLHGGAVDVDNCSASNPLNDVPCNFGVGPNTPADYLDVLGALSIPALANEDGFELTTDALNLTPVDGHLPFDPDDVASVRAWLQDYDSVLLFKHWSTGMTDALQTALVEFVDDGGGMVALHHALYNDVRGALDKDILVEQVFGVHSPMGTWAGSSLQAQDLLFTQAGHYITSFHLAHRLPAPVAAAPSWSSFPLPAGANPGGATYQRIALFDEIYNNWTVLPGSVFGHGLGEIEPLLATTGTPAGATHLAGFSKRVDPSGDGSIGRVVFLMPGERKESFAAESLYPRLVRNALLWSANLATPSDPGPGTGEPIFFDGFERP